MLNQTRDYLDTFARFKQKENIEAVERLLSQRPELELFERSQLGKLDFSGLQSGSTFVLTLIAQ